jgi:hypothetical protein
MARTAATKMSSGVSFVAKRRARYFTESAASMSFWPSGTSFAKRA